MDSAPDEPLPTATVPSSPSTEEGEAAESDPQAPLIRGLALLIACTDLPVTVGETFSFVDFIQSLNPDVSAVPKSTILSKLVKIFNEMKPQLKSELSNFKGVISITCALWIDENEFNYICVAAHFIDSDWMMQKRMIAFRMIEYPYDANNVFEIMIEVFTEYEIINKISSITFDNGAFGANSADTDADDDDVDGAIFDMFKNYLKPPFGDEFFVMRCVCDMINSIVRNGLSLIDEHLERIRCVIHYVYLPHERRQEFYSLCKSHNLTCRKLKPDYLDQWNSTMMMLESCVNYDEVITEYNNSKIDDNLLCEKDWVVSFALLEFMKIFYSAVNVCSKVYCPTSCVVLNQLYDISAVFGKYRDHSLFGDMCGKLEESFKKYLECCKSPVFCLSAVMDPRIKLDGVELLLNGISENLNMSLSEESEKKNVSK